MTDLKKSSEIDKELNSLPSKSAKIRFLTNKGWNRSTIANYLGIRYQHVRNVQITPIKKKA
jgi:hypothetical protein